MHEERRPQANSVGEEGVATAPLGACSSGACDGRCPGPRAKEDEHGEQASLPRGKAPMECKGTGKRPDLRLPGLRKKTRYAPTRETEWPPGAPPGSSPPM